MKSNNILPIGFYDLIFKDAKSNHDKVNLVLNYFMNNGYQLVKTPLIEFANGYSEEQKDNSFEFVDPQSGKNLILRSDTTLQISRLISTYFPEHKDPIKLCYVSDVLQTKSDELYADRQLTQIGVEYVGCKQDSELEIISLVLSALNKISKKDMVIEFSLPGFVQDFILELNIGNQEGLLRAIKDKNISEIKKLCDKKYVDLILGIVLKNSGVQDLVKNIYQVTDSEIIRSKIDKAMQIQDFIESNFGNFEIFFDLFGDDIKSYHQDIVFDVFAHGFAYKIARGGKYNLNGRNSVGATIYVNYLRKIEE